MISRSNVKSGARFLTMTCAAGSVIFLSGCHEDMWNQPKVRPYVPSPFFSNGMSARLPVPHTVDQAHFWTDEGRYTGFVGTRIVNGKLILGRFVTKFPFKIGMKDLKRGQKEFDIFCTPCHGMLGNGKGEIAMRGLALRRPPASYLGPGLISTPIGHFYDVITNGFGAMYPFASHISPDDRWRIVAYIRVLERSANAKASDIPADYPGRQQLIQEMGTQAAAGAAPKAVIESKVSHSVTRGMTNG